MIEDTHLRDASPDDAVAVASIGGRAMQAQYEGLVDPAAVEAAVRQTYAPSAVAGCIMRCLSAPDGIFIVAESAGHVIGFLHFDCFGPEPELHRLYLAPQHRSRGVGSLLMKELHERLPPGFAYMLLVVEGNDRAVRFYERNGLVVAAVVEGLVTYRERMGVVFPPGSRSFNMVLMRREIPEVPALRPLTP